MADDQDEVVIVGNHGEYHFPAGMDPKKAAQVVRNKELEAANATPLKEPTTKVGGMLKGFFDTYKLKGADDPNAPLNKGLQDYESKQPKPGAYEKFMSDPIAHPTGTMADDLLAPQNILGAIAMAMGSPAVRRGMGGAMEFAGDNVDLMKPLKMVGKLGTALKSGATPSTSVPVDRYLPNSGGIDPVPEPTASGRVPYASPTDLSSDAPSARLAGKAPTLNDVLVDALNASRDTTDPPKASMAPPDAETVGESSLRQSGTFKKSEKMGQPGGYTSGRPSVSDIPIREEPPTTDQGEAAPPVQPQASLEDTLYDMARKRMGIDAIRRLAPGPSRIPNAAQDRINTFNANQASDNDDDPLVKGIIAALTAGMSGKLLASQQQQ
jgi:hypothetical protein